jgi:hypothetical protein
VTYVLRNCTMDDLCPKELHNEGVTYVLRNCTMDDLCPKELHNG